MAANDDHRDDTLRLSSRVQAYLIARMTPAQREAAAPFVCAVCAQPYARPEDRIERNGRYYHRECLWTMQQESEETK